MIALQIFVEKLKKKKFHFKNSFIQVCFTNSDSLKNENWSASFFFIIFYELAISEYSWKKKYTRHFKSGRDC